jgi:Sec-independent protein translocase protein TatA
MSLFGVGIMELVLVVMIALIVAGPKRMLHWAYLTGRFIAQAQHTWSKAISAMQKEFDEAGVDLHLPKDPTNREEMRRFKEEALKPIRQPMEQAIRDYHEEQRSLHDEIKQIDADAMNSLKSLDGEPSQDGASADGESTPPAPQNNYQGTGFGTWSNRGNGAK